MCKSMADSSFDHRENKGIDLQKLAVVVTALSILQFRPSPRTPEIGQIRTNFTMLLLYN